MEKLQMLFMYHSWSRIRIEQVIDRLLGNQKMKIKFTDDQ